MEELHSVAPGSWKGLARLARDIAHQDVVEFGIRGYDVGEYTLLLGDGNLKLRQLSGQEQRNKQLYNMRVLLADENLPIGVRSSTELAREPTVSWQARHYRQNFLNPFGLAGIVWGDRRMRTLQVYDLNEQRGFDTREAFWICLCMTDPHTSHNAPRVYVDAHTIAAYRVVGRGMRREGEWSRKLQSMERSQAPGKPRSWEELKSEQSFEEIDRFLHEDLY